MKFYLVDYENTHEAGLVGLNKLDANAETAPKRIPMHICLLIYDIFFKGVYLSTKYTPSTKQQLINIGILNLMNSPLTASREASSQYRRVSRPLWRLS